MGNGISSFFGCLIERDPSYFFYICILVLATAKSVKRTKTEFLSGVFVVPVHRYMNGKSNILVTTDTYAILHSFASDSVARLQGVVHVKLLYNEGVEGLGGGGLKEISVIDFWQCKRYQLRICLTIRTVRLLWERHKP